MGNTWSHKFWQIAPFAEYFWSKLSSQETKMYYCAFNDFKWVEIKDLNSFTWRSRLSLFLSPFPHSLIHSLAQCVHKCERIWVFLFIDLFYYIWNQFRAAFLFTVARLPFPLESLVSLSLSLPSNWFKYVYRKTNCTHNTLLTLGGVESPSERAMNGETELKTYFVGDLKHNAVNYDFFSLFLLETSSFLAAPILPLLFLSLTHSRMNLCSSMNAVI